MADLAHTEEHRGYLIEGYRLKDLSFQVRLYTGNGVEYLGIYRESLDEAVSYAYKIIEKREGPAISFSEQLKAAIGRRKS